MCLQANSEDPDFAMSDLGLRCQAYNRFSMIYKCFDLLNSHVNTCRPFRQ